VENRSVLSIALSFLGVNPDCVCIQNRSDREKKNRTKEVILDCDWLYLVGDPIPYTCPIITQGLWKSGRQEEKRRREDSCVLEP